MAKIRESSGNVFIDLGFPPLEAAVMLQCAQLAEASLADRDCARGIISSPHLHRLGHRHLAV